VKQERLRNVSEFILAYLTSFQGPHKTVVECTAGWYWLSDLLEAHGFECILAHAKYLKAISYENVKTDEDTGFRPCKPSHSRRQPRKVFGRGYSSDRTMLSGTRASVGGVSQ